MSVIYKTLFEVKLLHEFYLTNQEGKTIFEEAAPDDRINFLMQKFTGDLPSVNNNLRFEIPEEIKNTFENYRLRLLTTYSGFKVTAKVTKSSLADGTIAYKPLMPLPPDLNLVVELNRTGNLFDNITNARINTPIPAMCYFSNETVSGTKTFPFLSNNISAKDITATYEQGELADAGAGLIQSFYKNDSGNQWLNVAGKGFTSENDRLAVPFKFSYSFRKNSGVTVAQFILKDKNGQIVKDKKGNIPAPVTATGSAELQKVRLNFDTLELKTVLDKPFSDELIYTLEVTGNNGYSKNHKIIFYGIENFKNTWGIVQLKTAVTNPDFKLVDNNGFIFIQKNPDGSIKKPAPLFEIRIKSRFTYWKYININNKELNLTVATTPYLDDSNPPYLITKTPRSLTASLTLFPPFPSGTYLPNPAAGGPLNIIDDRFFTNIEVPNSSLFPIV
ncbi:MAG TPA: hypothetical protein VJY62_01110 [Bacteroidia bacterium]|nr:hypothetical protein [Bacteroidia bacterium]